MSNNRTIKAYFEANRRLLSETRDFPLAIAQTFLGVVLWGDEVDAEGNFLTLEDIAVRVGFSPTTASQHLRYLGAYYRKGKPGLGLIVTSEDPNNRRRKQARLTPKGLGVVRQLELIFRKLG